MKFTRARENLTAWTFDIPSVGQLLGRYVNGGKGWADPFAANSRFAEWRNDLNPKSHAKYHMEAEEFIRTVLPDDLNGIIFDPPYSKRQISECYAGIGLKATQEDTSELFYNRVKRAFEGKVRPGGYCISMGYSTRGVYGWEDVEMLDVVANNDGAYDILVLVQRKPPVAKIESFDAEAVHRAVCE